MDTITLEKDYKIEVIKQENGRFAVVLFSPSGEIVNRHWTGTLAEAEEDAKLLQNNARNIIMNHEND